MPPDVSPCIHDYYIALLVTIKVNYNQLQIISRNSFFFIIIDTDYIVI